MALRSPPTSCAFPRRLARGAETQPAPGPGEDQARAGSAPGSRTSRWSRRALNSRLQESPTKAPILAVAGAAALSLCAQAALADQWVDYTPVKGTYVKTLVHVEPNRIDDYLVALKKAWIPTEESAKRHGVIDSYMVQVNLNPYTSGPNVILIEQYPSMATMDPEKTRDMAIDKEAEQILPKAQAPAVSSERAKYRTIVGQEMWSVIDFK